MGYVASGPVWIGGYYPSYPIDTGYDDPGVQNLNQSPEGYDAGPPDQGPPMPPGVYPPSAAVPGQAPEPASEDGVTLVFKDGRPPVQVHDYVLTQNKLYVWDRHQMVIPIDLLDMAATTKANQEAGVDFKLPEVNR